jgi:hypothetical protein
MTLKKRGKYQYGDSQADIRDELLRYSKKNEHAAHHFADAICKCDGKLFELSLDDNEGARRFTAIGRTSSVAIKSYSSGCSCSAEPSDAPKSPVGR